MLAMTLGLVFSLPSLRSHMATGKPEVLCSSKGSVKMCVKC